MATGGPIRLDFDDSQQPDDLNNPKEENFPIDQSIGSQYGHVDVDKLSQEDFDRLIANEARMIAAVVKKDEKLGLTPQKRKAEWDAVGSPAKLFKSFLTPTPVEQLLEAGRLEVSAISRNDDEFESSPVSSSLNGSEKCRSGLNETFSLSPTPLTQQLLEEKTVVRPPVVASTPLMAMKTISLATVEKSSAKEKLSGTFTRLPTPTQVKSTAAATSHNGTFDVDKPTPTEEKLSGTFTLPSGFLPHLAPPKDKLNGTYDIGKTYRIPNGESKRPALEIPAVSTRKSLLKADLPQGKTVKTSVMPMKALPIPQQSAVPPQVKSSLAAASKIPSTSGLKRPVAIASLKRPSLVESRRSTVSTSGVPQPPKKPPNKG